MILMLLLLYLLQIMLWESHQLPRPYDNNVRGELWGNQTGMEVVNGSQLLNMLQSCSGCLVTIKSDPASGKLDENNTSGRATLLKTPNATVTELFIYNQTKDGGLNGTIVSQARINMNDLGAMLNKCQDCYVDNKKKSHAHAKVKQRKVKGTSTKDYESKSEDRYIQPPETPEQPGNIPYGESELSATNEVPPLDKAPRKNDATENLTDEQLGNTEPLRLQVEGKRIMSRCRRADTGCTGDDSRKSKANKGGKNYHAYNSSQHNATDTKEEKRPPVNTENSQGRSRIGSLAAPLDEKGENLVDEAITKNTTTGERFGEEDDIKEFSKNSVVQPAELNHMIEKDDVRLVDLREGWELNHEGTISKAINIPLNSLSLALRSADKNFKRKYGISKPKRDDCNLVFFDQSGGGRADVAHKFAAKRGFRCNKSLKGGFDLWKHWIAYNEHLLL